MAISYFGGKQKMAEWIYPFIPRKTEIYVEPFSGAFWVYMNINGDYSHINTIVYNDINKHMVNLYACLTEYETFQLEFDKAFAPGGILHNSGDLDKYKEDMKALYYKYKKDKSDGNFLDNPPRERPDFEAGVVYAFLISSAFNACYPRAAGCSAFNKDRLKINALLNKMKDERYQNKFKNITNVENLDFEDLIKKYDTPGTFFYLDPPYEDKDNKRLDWYGVGDDNAFGRASHERLCKLLKNVKSKWALSYYYFNELEEWLPKDKYRWEYKEFFRSSASFSDSKDEMGTEVLIMNYDMDDEEYTENSTYFKATKPRKTTKSKKKIDKELINKVVDQIKLDIEIGDTDAIESLLSFVPVKNLVGYLPDIEITDEQKEELDKRLKSVSKTNTWEEVKEEIDPDDKSGLLEASGLKEIFKEPMIEDEEKFSQEKFDECFDDNLKGFVEKQKKKEDETDDFWG